MKSDFFDYIHFNTMKKTMTLVMMATITWSYAQVGIGTTTPNASAALEISSTTQGILIPRVALTGSSSASPITSPATGLLVYNTATVGTLTAGFYFNSGTSSSPSWSRLYTNLDSPDFGTLNISSSSTSFVAEIENTSTSSTASGLGIYLGPVSPDYNNKFLAFYADAGGVPTEVGNISSSSGSTSYAYEEIENNKWEDLSMLASSGVQLGSTGADYAEFMRKMDRDETFFAGDIVGVHEGRVSHATDGADKIMVISKSPIVLGNKPIENTQDYLPVAFLGQVMVRVDGPVQTGDFIIASGENNGKGIAVPRGEVTLAQMPLLVGQAWSSSNEQRTKLIRVGIVPMNEIIPFDLNQLIQRVQQLEQRVQQIEADNGITFNE